MGRLKDKLFIIAVYWAIFIPIGLALEFAEPGGLGVMIYAMCVFTTVVLFLPASTGGDGGEGGCL